MKQEKCFGEVKVGDTTFKIKLEYERLAPNDLFSTLVIHIVPTKASDPFFDIVLYDWNNIDELGVGIIQLYQDVISKNIFNEEEGSSIINVGDSSFRLYVKKLGDGFCLPVISFCPRHNPGFNCNIVLSSWTGLDDLGKEIIKSSSKIDCAIEELLK